MQLLLSMIVDGLCNLAIFILNLIPDITLPNFDFSVISDLGGYVDSFVSLSVLSSAVAVILIVDSISFSTRILKFILNKFALG